MMQSENPIIAHRLTLAAALALMLGSGSAAAEEEQLRIVGGQPAGPGEYPFMAALMSNGYQFCGGSLVAPNWVLTAAHCVQGERASDVQILLGSNDLNSGGQRIGAKRLIVHPAYNGGTPDVALIELNQSAAQQPVSLLEPGSSLDDPGKAATVIGWGLTSENGGASDTLMEVQVPIVSDTICNQAYGGYVDTPQEICAGLAEGGKDACNGDSGGPLFVAGNNGGFFQAGVVSWGDGCARANAYGVYARVSAQKDWIDSYVGGSSPTPDPEPTPDPTPNPTPEPDPGPISASFTVDCNGLSCSFDASGSAGGGSAIEDYYWDFGDGGWDQGRRVSYSYRSAGSYEVWLGVINQDGDYDEQIRQVTVNGGSGGGSGSGYLNEGESAVEPMQLAVGDALEASLVGPQDMDFDLFLERFVSRSNTWKKVRASAGPAAGATLRYTVKYGGEYRFVVNAYRGSGEYQLTVGK